MIGNSGGTLWKSLALYILTIGSAGYYVWWYREEFGEIYQQHANDVIFLLVVASIILLGSAYIAYTTGVERGQNAKETDANRLVALHEQSLEHRQSELAEREHRLDRDSQRIVLYKDLERRLNEAVRSAGPKGFIDHHDLGDRLRQSLSGLHSVYLDVLAKETLEAENTMGAITLEAYLKELAAQRVAGTNIPLLPANFTMYAECVIHILEELIHTSWFGCEHTITISTFLNTPVERWYNICDEACAYGPAVLHYTTDEWENYKSNNQALRHACTGTQPSPPVQLRRLVHSAIFGNVEPHTYVYAPDGEARAIEWQRAKQIVASIPPTIKLLDEVQATLNDQRCSDYKVHLLAKSTSSAGNPSPQVPSEWNDIKIHFTWTYHNGIHAPHRPISPDARGVFCAFTDDSWLRSNRQPWTTMRFRDLFIVDTGEQQGRFGIGLHEDEGRLIAGLVFLDDAQIGNALSRFDELWNSAHGKRRAHG